MFMDSSFEEQHNQWVLEQITADPECFLEIPHTDHVDDHHAILREFLVSAWTEDEQRRVLAADIYDVGHSIGGWRKQMDDKDVWDAFVSFREAALAERATVFLRQHGVEPEWWG